MYCEDLIFKVQNGEEAQNNLQQFYYANFGLVLKFMGLFNVREYEKEDFSQLCFIACMSAVKAYRRGTGNSFLAYYRRCILHEFYKYKLEMRFPVKVSQTDYQKVETEGIEFYQQLDGVLYAKLDDTFEKVEMGLASDALWSAVHDSLDSISERLIVRNYLERVPLKEVGAEMGMDFKEVRRVHQAALRTLKRNTSIREIAKYFYNIV
jgi:RNA polymerase sigma factor (sigma-70 family)